MQIMTTLLIDGDLYAFSTAIAFQTENPFNGDINFDAKTARMIIDQRMKNLMDKFNTHKIIMFFSCHRAKNWRRQLVNSYKMNREGKLTPVGLTGLITYMKSNYDYVEEPTLEADDLLGIYATDQDKCTGDSIICSWDKDFLTVPTMIFNKNKNKIITQSRKDALKFFLYQVMIGDSADGYKGIKGVGPKGATQFLVKNAKKLASIWEPLCDLAAQKKHDEQYLLEQCRMAHILQKDDFNFVTKEIRLWEPEMIVSML